MEPQEIAITDQTAIDIVMATSSQQIEEVVVTTGYQKIDRKLFTGSAQRLSAEEAKIDGIMDVGRMLEGKSAGVQVQECIPELLVLLQRLEIRGASSIYGDQKPLWVVEWCCFGRCSRCFC